MLRSSRRVLRAPTHWLTIAAAAFAAISGCNAGSGDHDFDSGGRGGGGATSGTGGAGNAARGGMTPMGGSAGRSDTTEGGDSSAGAPMGGGGNERGGAGPSGGTPGSAGEAGSSPGGGGAGGAGGAPEGTGGTLVTGGRGGATSGGATSGGATSGGAGGSGGSVAPDTTKPTVVAISPEPLATGVASNEKIQLTFSEAMNKTSVASALSVSTFTAGNLGLSWSTDGKTLTVTPTGGLGYATGMLNVSARAFAVALTTAAQDLAGNALSAAFSSTFYTLRRISQSVYAPSAQWDTYGPSVGGSIQTCPGSAENFEVGTFACTGPSSCGGDYLLYVSVDASALPTQIQTMESARLVAQQVAPTGAFYPTGAVVLDKLVYGPFDNNIQGLAVTAPLGVFASSAAASPGLDITDSFWPDVQQRFARQLFRLKGTGGPVNTYAGFACAGFALELTYLIP